MPPLIEFLSSPVGQALVWWQVSKRVKVLDTTNKLIVGKEILELADLIPTVDLDLLDVPPSIQLGALIQEIEDFQQIPFQKIAEDVAQGVQGGITGGAGAGAVAGAVAGDIITQGFDLLDAWLKSDPLEGFGKPPSIG